MLDMVGSDCLDHPYHGPIAALAERSPSPPPGHSPAMASSLSIDQTKTSYIITYKGDPSTERLRLCPTCSRGYLRLVHVIAGELPSDIAYSDVPLRVVLDQGWASDMLAFRSGRHRLHWPCIFWFIGTLILKISAEQPDDRRRRWSVPNPLVLKAMHRRRSPAETL